MNQGSAHEMEKYHAKSFRVYPGTGPDANRAHAPSGRDGRVTGRGLMATARSPYREGMTTRADVQRVFDKLATAATAHTLDPSEAKGEKLLSLLRELETKLQEVGEQATARSAAENYRCGQTSGSANHDLGVYLNSGAIGAMQHQIDSLAGR